MISALNFQNEKVNVYREVLEDENSRLKNMHAELSPDNVMLKELLSKNGKPCC